MQQPVAPPPVWNGPHIPAGLLPWQLSTNTFQNAPSAHVPIGLPSGHAPLRRTVSSPGRRRFGERTYLFGEVNQVPSPLGFVRQESDSSNAPAKQTSSPIEIPDSPSSPSVITVSSSSDEMEPTLLTPTRLVAIRTTLQRMTSTKMTSTMTNPSSVTSLSTTITVTGSVMTRMKMTRTV